MQVQLVVPSLLISLGLIACSGAKTQKGQATGQQGPQTSASGSSDNADKAKEKDQTDTKSEEAEDDRPTLSDSEFDIPKIVANLSFKLYLDQNQTGKIYSGFDGQNQFKFFLGAALTADFSKGPKLSESQMTQIYKSKDYHKKLENAALALKIEATDPTLFSMNCEYGTSNVKMESKDCILVSLKAGSTTIKVTSSYGNLSIPVSIASYTPQQVTLGMQRYNTAVTSPTPSPSCASCHMEGQFFERNSVTFASQFSEEAILSFVEKGLNTDTKNEVATHKMYFASPAQRAAIVPFLRTLQIGPDGPNSPGM